MTYDRKRLIDVVQRDALQRGSFTLASGQQSSYYIDCRKVTLSAEGAGLVAAGILERTADDPMDAIGGLTLGADPIVGATLALAGVRGIKLRGFIVRKAAKDYATGKLIEGPLRKGDRVVIVEDTTTTGGSALRAADAVTDAGCSVVRVVTVVDRLAGAREIFSERKIKFSPLLTIRDLGLPDE